MSKQIWLSPDNNGWKIHKPGSERAIRREISTKKEAEEIMNSIAKNQWLETKIQRKDWVIQWWNTYWKKDPFPPRW